MFTNFGCFFITCLYIFVDLFCLCVYLKTANTRMAIAAMLGQRPSMAHRIRDLCPPDAHLNGQSGRIL